MKRIINNMLNFMALGDSNGIPYENISPKKSNKKTFKIKKHLRINNNFFTSDKISDDTEHFMITLKAILDTERTENKKSFELNLKKGIVRWFSSLPAGIGKATLISCFKMCVKSKNTGYFSAGNGPMMRSGVIGAYYFNNEKIRQEYINASTRLTHTDPLAFLASHSHADIVSYLVAHKEKELSKEELLNNIVYILKLATQKTSIDEKSSKLWQSFIASINELSQLTEAQFHQKHFSKKGVTGFIIDTLKCVIANLYHQKTPLQAIETCLKLGGDTDTSAAISASTNCLLKDTIDHSNYRPINTEIFMERIEMNWFKRTFNSFVFFFYCIYQLKNII